MASTLSEAIVGLSSSDLPARTAAAKEIYRCGRTLADQATHAWRTDAKFSVLLGPHPSVTVGLAVERDTFARIRQANGVPRLAEVPPDQDAEEFELHFPGQISLDILTTREPGGRGAIARYLSRFGEGVQQVEYRCSDVNAATNILRQEFGISPVYAQSRRGADGTLINFFLVEAPGAGKVLIELYQFPATKS
jgi:methylmalonyl-CoA/ethylmalonyl-CoA epimerase